MAAQMTFKPILPLMKGQGDTAIRAFADEAALVANQGSGESPSVEEQNRLFLCGQASLDRTRQSARDQRHMFLFEVLLPHVDHADQVGVADRRPGRLKFARRYFPVLAF